MRSKQKILLILNALLIGSCSTSEVVEPEDLKIYVGSSEDFALVRKQSNEIMSCFEKDIDDMVCMSKKDFNEFVIRNRFRICE